MRNKNILLSGEISESAMQKAVFDWISLKPTICDFIFHIANEGKRTPSYGKKLKDMGMRPGVSDIFVAIQRKGFGGAWIELKTEQGKLTLLQQKFLCDMKEQGYYTGVCYSIESAISILEWYCFD